MIQTTLRIVPTRTAREIMLGKRFQIQARFPGGRIIPLGYSKTRSAGFAMAQRIARAQTSPTAGGFYNGGGLPGPIWDNNNAVIVIAR
ncbi:MAG: hypothetical protein V4659_07115 [Pseudomonadota bacterium]